MRTRRHHRMLLAFAITLAWPNWALAQDQSAPQDNYPKPLSPKELKRRQQQIAKELGRRDDWLNDVVPDIITPEERRAFLELSTNEERDQFKEDFWQRRNPD